MPDPVIPKILTSAACLHRQPEPVLTRADIPYPATLIFNAGVCKYQGRYVMIFRNDVGRWNDPKFDYTNLGLAFSKDGIHWEVHPKPIWDGNEPRILDATDGDVRRVYDPRLHVIDGRVCVCFAVDTNHGVRGGMALTDDFQAFKILSLSAPDNRNMVLLTDKVNGKYVRLERPMPVYSRGRDRFDIWMSHSPDLIHWGNTRLVAGVEDFPFANDKVGPGAPPIKTSKGWLTLVHCVDRDNERGKNGWEPRWQKRYTAGLMLLDLENPHKVIGLSKHPLIAPEAPFERDGFRNDVIFPGGMILEDSGEVKIYYGAADTVECLATADVGDLLKLVS